MKFPIIKTGFYRLANKDNASLGELSLIKVLKRIFSNFGISYVDPCCAETLSFPVRFILATKTFEYFNEGTWYEIVGQLSVSGTDVLEWDGSTWNVVGTLNP